MSQTMTLQLRINADGTAAVTALRGVQQGLTNTGAAARTADTGLQGVVSGLKGLAMTAGAALSVGALAQSFIQANIESQRLQKGLTAVAGSATAGAAEMDYISKTADKLGLSLTATGSAYVGLTAATKGTALEGQATRDIFESVSLAMGKLGKSSADTEGALQAVQQMVSKGVVSAEELRGQLGERLPGAFKLAAEAIGVTEAELGKMLESGEILATDLLPALSQKLNTLYNDGKAVGGLEASWNILNNALDRMMVSADNASGGTKMLGDMLLWATGKANAFAEALTVIDNWRQGKGFAYGERDGIADEWALRAKLVDEYVVKMKDAQAYADSNDLDNSAARRAEGEALIARINEIDAKVKTTRADVKAARTEAEALASRNASGMGDDAIRLYREHQAAIATNAAEVEKLNGKYDKGIAKKAEYAQMEKTLAEAVKLGSMTQEQATAKLEAFAAAQDKATAASGRKAKALSAEAQVVADIEKKYGLMAGQLDAVWKLESGRGKTAGTSSERWVKDLAAGEGHMTKIVGQFQMAEGTARGLGANMGTFNGQADAAGKYLAEAAAKGKTLWEQFAYYHGGPNEKAWGEKTRAYADAAVKLVATSGGAMRDIGQNTGKEITDMLTKAKNAVDGMIARYLPARATAAEYAQAQRDLALASDAAGLSQEEQAIILQGLQKDFEKSKIGATETANAWSEVWKNAVKRIDDTFANLWKDLFSGTKTTLESMKSAIASWLAEVAHALLTKPLVVAITTAMTGATGTAGAATNAVSGASNLSGLSNIGSLFSSIYSLGSTFISGLSEGIMGMFSTNMFSTLGTAWGAATSGSSMGAAAGAGVIAAYALPLVAAGGLILSKYFKDQEPRYGAYGATTTGRSDQFEDEVGVKGGFGLTFGMNDMGTANVDAEEMRQLFEGFAAVSTALENFYGKDVSSKVTESLSKASMENWGKNGLMNYAMNAEQAFQIAFADIIKHAAATGDDLAIVMSSVVGGLSGTMEEMATQIERGMQTSSAALGMANAFQGQEMANTLDLKGTLVDNALKLVDYANQMKGSGESTAEAMGRLALNLTSFDAALIMTGSTTAATGMAFIDLANSLAKAADEAKIGIKGLLELQNFYAQQFLGPQVAFANAARAAQLQIDKVFADLADAIAIPGNRDTFMELVESLDLTTTAGQALYVELMKLGPAFDLLFDAQEQFTNWLDPVDPAKKALQELGDVFGKWGMTLPTSKNALLELYRSGKLSTEQMAILGSHLDALKLIFPDLVEVIDSVGESIVDLTDLHIRLARTLGDEGMASWLERQRELASAGDDASRAMLLMIYAAEDLAKQVGKDGQRPNFNTVLLTALGREMGKGFANFDPNGDQATTPAELATALGDLVGGKELTKLMASLDKNSDGQLSVLEQLPLLIAANLAPLFEQFDTNKDGGLSLAELRTSLNGVVDEQQLKAIYDLMDVNGDGLVDKLEAVRLSLYTSMRDIVSAVDTTGDKQLSPEELRKTFKNASDPEAMLKRVYDILDRNQDGLINALEAIPLSIAGGLADKFALIDTSGDLQLSFDELKAAYGDMASDDQLTNLIRLADLNGDGQISAQEAGNMKLDLIALKADKLSDVVQAIRDQETAFLIGIHDVETAITTGLNQLASGLGITDSAKSAALAMPLNLIQVEAGNSVDLRVALQELRSELQALRQSQERTETSRQTSATAMQAATANLGSAVASMPARIEVILPALSGEAGY
jgi:tape measure domain-containing protein